MPIAITASWSRALIVLVLLGYTAPSAEAQESFLDCTAINQIKPGALAALSEETKRKMAAALYEATVDPQADVMAGFYTQQLVEMGKSAVPTILQLLQHKDSKYRALAAQVLGSSRFSDQQIEAELIKLARDDAAPFVRVAAAQSLGESCEPSERVKAALLAIIKNPPPLAPNETDVKNRANWNDWRDTADISARSLARFGPNAIDDLVPLLTPLNAPTRLPAITALKSIGAPAVPRLVEFLADKDRSVAVSASVALGRMGRPAVPGLARAVSTGNEQVIDHATSALWWIGPDAKAALPNLLELAGSQRNGDLSRLAAARAALRIDASSSQISEAILSTIPVFIRILDTGSFKHQGWAAETLGNIGSPAHDALPTLRKRLELPDQNTDTGGLVRDYVQRSAQDAITKIEAALDSAKTP